MKNKNAIVIFILLLLNLSFVSFFSPIITASSTFGSTGTTGTLYDPAGKTIGGYFQMGSINGNGNYIKVYLDGSLVDTDCYFKCRLADSSGVWVTNGLTEEGMVAWGSSAQWYQVNFDLSPSLTGNAYYYICLLIGKDSINLAPRIPYATSGGLGVKIKSLTNYPTWSSSFTSLSTVDADGILRIYCDYTEIPSNPNPPSNFNVEKIIGSTNSLYCSWSKGTGADYTRIQYKTGSNPASITDGTNGYNGTGTYYTQSSLQTDVSYYFSAWSWNTTNKLWSLTYVSDNEKPYGRPIKPTLLYSGFDLDDLKDILYWTIGTNATHHMIRYSVSAYPTSITDGTLWYNGTGYSYYYGNTDYQSKYFSIWAWDNNCKLWSADYRTGLMTINATCSSGSITVHNQTTYTNDGYDISGLHIWLNYTGIQPTLNHYENIADATGTHEHKSSNGGHTISVWANYTGDECPPCIPVLHKYQNIINATGWNNSSIVGEDVYVWTNYTGNTTPITQYENIVDATGTHAYILTLTGYKDWANYTGIGSGCSGVVWVNYTDKNITFNVSVNKTDDSNTSTYTILEDFWLYLGSTISLDAFTLLLVYLFAILYFVYSNKTNDLFIRTQAHRIFILFSVILLFGIEVGEFITDLGMTDLQRAMLLPFIPVFIILLWLIRKPKEES